ncbi:MAG: hypothetical protein AAGM38_15455 [Pseudomonadota bacterium]
MTLRGAHQGQETTLRIMRLEDDQYLADAGWRTAVATIGPLPAAATADGAVIVRLGPPYTTHLEPFQRIRVEAPGLGVSAEVSWPEDVGKALGAAAAGDIFHQPRPSELTGPHEPFEPVTPAQPPEPPQPPEPVDPPQLAEPPKPEDPPKPADPPEPPHGADEEPGEEDEVDKEPPKDRRLLWGLAALAAAAALAVAVILADREQPQPVPPPEPLPTPQPLQPPRTCEDGTLGAAAEELFEQAMACQSIGDKARMISLIDVAARAGYGPAHLQKGRFRDATQGTLEDSPFEQQLDHLAAASYREALDLGVEEARPLLEAVCERLTGDQSSRARGALRRHCN